MSGGGGGGGWVFSATYLTLSFSDRNILNASVSSLLVDEVLIRILAVEPTQYVLRVVPVELTALYRRVVRQDRYVLKYVVWIQSAIFKGRCGLILVRTEGFRDTACICP